MLGKSATCSMTYTVLPDHYFAWTKDIFTRQHANISFGLKTYSKCSTRDHDPQTIAKVDGVFEE